MYKIYDHLKYGMYSNSYIYIYFKASFWKGNWKNYEMYLIAKLIFKFSKKDTKKK